MTFLSSEVLEAVQLKDSLLVDSAAEHCWFRCKFQNVILELITEAPAREMQVNAVINAV